MNIQENQPKSNGLGGTVFEFPKGVKRQAVPDTMPESVPVDLMRHIPDGSFRRYVVDVAKMCQIPQNTSLLIGLGIVSSVACRVYTVLYPNGDPLPLGEYIACSQPPGTGKSRMLKAYQYPINTTQKELYRAYTDRKKAAEAAGTEFDEQPPVAVFTTDSTPEGIDSTLSGTGGYFALASAEQGLINSLMGANYGGDGKKNNNDLALKGFNGEYHSSTRTTRKGYRGEVVGGITCFAQEGAIETILTKNEGVGFAERFLMLAEPNQLGRRDHTKEHYPAEYDQNVYNRIMGELTTKALATPEDFAQLPAYRLGKASWAAIHSFRNEVEPHLADGGKYSTATMRGTAAKVDMHIMKLAALLAILDDQPNGEIGGAYVGAAIGIMRDMLGYTSALLEQMGVTGRNTFEEAVINYLGDKKQATRKQFQSAKTRCKPWAEITPSKAIGQTMRATIDGLIAKGIVGESETFDALGNSMGKVLRLVA